MKIKVKAGYMFQKVGTDHHYSVNKNTEVETYMNREIGNKTHFYFRLGGKKYKVDSGGLIPMYHKGQQTTFIAEKGKKLKGQIQGVIDNWNNKYGPAYLVGVDDGKNSQYQVPERSIIKCK